MNRAELAATSAGGFGVLAVLASAVPYVLLDGSSVAGYYGVGPVSPPIIAIFVAVALVVAFSGAAGRADPPTVAAVTLVLGVTATGLAVWWAVAASDVVGGLPIAATFEWHRWGFVAALAGQTAASAVYANRVLRG